MEWLDNNTIKVDPIQNPKLITGTKLAAILGKNPYKTEFEVFCNNMRLYEKPFEENIYTLCGKVIEDRQCKYLQKAYFVNVEKPEDIYGNDFFKKTHGNFYPNQKLFGGMWDAMVQEKGKGPVAVVECKTTQRPEDWLDDEGNITIPEYYALQGALYAYLLNIDDVYMIVSVLDAETYNEAEVLLDAYGIDKVETMIKDGSINDYISFEPSAKNTSVIPFKVSEKYPNFEELLSEASKWNKEHIETGISPQYDEKRDAEILKELRKNYINPDTDLLDLLTEAENIEQELSAVYDTLKPQEKRLKTLQDQIKTLLSSEFRDGDKDIVVNTEKSIFTLSRTERNSIDLDALENDGLLDKYQTTSISLRLTRKDIKKED